MKIILLFILLISINAYSQSSITNTPISDKTGLENDFQGKDVGYTKEWGYSYVKMGEGVFSVDGKKYGSSSFGFGHRNYAEEFVYGLEFNSLKHDKHFDNQQIIGSLGFHKQWKHRLKPFSFIQFGSSKLKLKEENINATGYYTGLDVGITMSVYNPFHFLGGMRWGIHNFSDDRISSATSQELYLLIGFEF